MSSPPERTITISRTQRWLETRLTNPALRWLLRSPLHRPISRWLVLLAYEGRRSGRPYAIPVGYVRADGGVVAAAPRAETNWWRNFRSPWPCAVWLRGNRRAATGSVVTGERRDALLAPYLERWGRLWGLPGADATDAADELAVVRFDVDLAEHPDGRTRGAPTPA